MYEEPAMPLGDRIRHRRHKRRMVRSGEHFSSDELERDEVELDLPEPAAEPPAEVAAEPWAWRGKVMPDSVASRLHLYQEFLKTREGGA